MTALEREGVSGGKRQALGTVQFASLGWNYNCDVKTRFIWAVFAEIYTDLGFVMINYKVFFCS